MTTVHSQLAITNAHKIWDTCRAYIGTELVADELLATSTDAEGFSSHTHTQNIVLSPDVETKYTTVCGQN